MKKEIFEYQNVTVVLEDNMELPVGIFTSCTAMFKMNGSEIVVVPSPPQKSVSNNPILSQSENVIARMQKNGDIVITIRCKTKNGCMDVGGDYSEVRKNLDKVFGDLMKVVNNNDLVR